MGGSLFLLAFAWPRNASGSFVTLKLNANSREQNVYRCYPEWRDEEGTVRGSCICIYLKPRREKPFMEPTGDTVNINKRAQSLLVGRFYRYVSAFQLPFLLPSRLLRPAPRLHVPDVLVFRFVWPTRSLRPWRKYSHLAGFSFCLSSLASCILPSDRRLTLCARKCTSSSLLLCRLQIFGAWSQAVPRSL